MKLLKKIIGGLALGALSLSLVACDFNAFKKKVDTEANKIVTKANQAVDGIDKNGHFEEDRSYLCNISGELNISLRITFKKNGDSQIINVADNSVTTEYTYKAEGNLITCTNKANSKLSYYYLYGDVIVEASAIANICATREGVAVSQRGTSIIGYVAYVSLNKGDVQAVLCDDKSNTNYYYKVLAKGDISTSKSRIIYDQLGKFDTSKEGTYVTTITINKKLYPAIVSVS